MRHLLAAVAAVTVALVAPATAAAHGDEGVIAIVAESPDAGLTVTYEVELTYLDDADPVSGAVILATATGPDGQTLGPVEMVATGTPGHYAVPLTYPVAGDWQLTLQTESPAASITEIVSVAVGTTETVPPTTPPSSMPSVDSTTAAAPSSAPGGAVASPAPEAEQASSDSGAPVALIVVAIAAGMAVLAIVIRQVTRRR